MEKIKDADIIQVLKNEIEKAEIKNEHLTIEIAILEKLCAHYAKCLTVFAQYDTEMNFSHIDRYTLQMSPLKYPKKQHLENLTTLETNNPYVMILAGKLASLELDNIKLTNKIAHRRVDKNFLEMKLSVYEKNGIKKYLRMQDYEEISFKPQINNKENSLEK